ncbi:MAG: PH domain-containing protein [Rhodomicrobium sp.]
MFPIIGILTALNKIRTSEFAVTDHRVMVKVGVIRRHSLEIMLPQVEGIGVDQGILGRILSYGTITVSGTGATHEHFIRIRNPLEFRRRVHVLVRGELPSCPPSSP